MQLWEDEMTEDERRTWRNVEDHDDFSGRVILWEGDGFSLHMERVYRHPHGGHYLDDNKDQWRYALTDEEWQSPTDMFLSPTVPIFAGDDFASPPWDDAPTIVAGLLGFLSLQPGDTDDEYFDKYTPRQTAWMEERAEMLSLVAYDQFEEM